MNYSSSTRVYSTRILLKGTPTELLLNELLSSTRITYSLEAAVRKGSLK